MEEDWERALVPGDDRYVPAVIRPQMPDVVRRAWAAGADAPLEYMGAGMTGVVFCQGGRAFKVARGTRDIDHLLFEEEAEWLAAAKRVPEVAPHVARLHRFDAENLVLVRDCPRSDPDQSLWRHERALYDLHRGIERAMIPHGWTAPEFKPDSYVLTTTGPVLVDASMPARVGSVLAAYVRAIVRGQRTLWTRRPSDLVFEVQREVGQTLSKEESDRLVALLVERWPELGPDVLRANPIRSPSRTKKATYTVWWRNPDKAGAWDVYQRDLSPRRAHELARTVQNVLSVRWFDRNVPTQVLPDGYAPHENPLPSPFWPWLVSGSTLALVGLYWLTRPADALQAPPTPPTPPTLPPGSSSSTAAATPTRLPVPGTLALQQGRHYFAVVQPGAAVYFFASRAQVIAYAQKRGWTNVQVYLKGAELPSWWPADGRSDPGSTFFVEADWGSANQPFPLPAQVTSAWILGPESLA